MNAIFAHWLSRLPLSIGIIVAAFYVSYLITPYLSGIFVASANASVIFNSALFMAIVCVCLLFGQLAMNVLRPGKTLMTFGFAPTRFALRHSLGGLIISFLSVGVILCLYICAGARIGEGASACDRIMYTTGFIFCAALVEELVFRGLLFESLSDRFGEVKTSIFTSVLFAAAHIFNPNLSVLGIVNVTLAGIMLAAMRIASRGLWMPCAFHFGWNWSIGALLGMPVSGQDFDSILNFAYSGRPSIWLGANFGVEEGLAATFLLLGSAAIVLRFVTPDVFITSVEFRRRFAEDQLLYSKT